MASEVEVLRGRVAQQEKQLRVLRAAVVGREELLAIPHEGVTQAWLSQFKRQLKDQAVREMKVANLEAAGAAPSAPAPAASPAAAKAAKEQNWKDVDVHKVTGPDPSALGADYEALLRIGEKEACDALVDTLLTTTKQLVGMWQDALRDRFRDTLSGLMRGFEGFKAAPSDATLQEFLGAVNELQPDIDTLLKTDDDFSGTSGNPYSTDYAELKAMYLGSIGRFSAACIDASQAHQRTASAPELEALKGRVAALETRLAEAAKEAAARTAQRDALYNDVAGWKHKHDVLKDDLHRREAAAAAAEAEDRIREEEAAAAAAAAAPQHRAYQHHPTATPAGRPSHSAYGATPRRGSLPSSRVSTPSLSLNVMPHRGAGASPRVQELRAALGHLEVQLTAVCNNHNGNNASSQRHMHIRRKIEAVRAELAREECGD
eukprot:TRINITY_DN2470_c1_g3_i2.p1 TRINITY_DN2470_c1_g3~~TRINITY_DN2470_c1_g3_i2.p1  ORF type:complete len:458 (+),score=183.04 TRINITY_DN2470_c1_g3_i2:80-1375(+)